MTVIDLNTLIRAPRERVFDLARSIDAHQDSTRGTEERAVAGVTKGLIGMGGEVTWEARHLGMRQRLTVRVRAFDRLKHFQDVMISGAFRSMVHDHEFAEVPTGTVLRNRFEFESPLAAWNPRPDGELAFPHLLHAAVPCPPESGAETVGGIHGRQPLL